MDRTNEEKLIEALATLTRYCTSGERYQTQNPYTVPAICQAIKALGEVTGWSGHWIDLDLKRLQRIID